MTGNRLIDEWIPRFDAPILAQSALDTPDGHNPIEGADGAQKPRRRVPTFARSGT